VCACVFCYRNVDKTTGHVKRQHWTPILDSSILPAIPNHPIQSSQTKRRQCSRVEAGPLSAGLTLKWFRAIRCPWLADSHHFSGLPATGFPISPSAVCGTFGFLRGLAADLDKDSATPLHMTRLKRKNGEVGCANRKVFEQTNLNITFCIQRTYFSISIVQTVTF